MIFLLHQLLTVVLAVDIDQIRADCLEYRRRHWPHIDAAHASALRRQLALNADSTVLTGVQTQLLELFFQLRGDLFKHRADKAFLFAVSDQLTARALSHNCANGIDDNRFARAGLTGQDGKARLKDNIRLLNDSDIFNMKQA